MFSKKEPCDIRCYKDGKGCFISVNGQCKVLYEDGKISQPYQSNRTYYPKVREHIVKPKTEDQI